MKAFLKYSSIGFLAGALLLGDHSAWALSYDPYAPVYKEELRSSGAKRVAANFLTYPFELVRWPLDQSILFTDRYRLDKKGLWLYQRVQDYGFTPYLRNISPSRPGGGVDVDFIRLTRQRQNVPDGVAKGWVRYSKDVYFQTGGEFGLDRIAGSGFRVLGNVQYEDRPEEHFYGIGPDTSAGDGTSFNMETTRIGTRTGYEWAPGRSVDFQFAYRNINITNGEDGGRGIIDRIFPAGSIPGLAGDELLDFEFIFKHDTRDHKGNSTKGGLRQFSAGYHGGIDSKAGFFRYRGQVSQYITLGSERRVLVLRAYGEHNNELSGHTVPFHQMARLGGYAGDPYLSETLRSYDYNRFYDESMILFNVEYRYNIWENGPMKMDAVLFWDQGQVFGEFSRFQLGDFRESYGAGVRISAAGHVFLSLELAHGDEGTNFYVKSHTPF